MPHGIGRVRPLDVAVAVVALAGTASCSALDGATGETETHEAVVAVFAPEGTASGEGVRAAVEVALDDALDEPSGWNVSVQLVNDTVDENDPDGDESVAEIAEQLVRQDVVAVIGGLSSETIRAAQPVFDDASLMFISPADTVAAHTRGADESSPLRPYDTYFRMAVPGEKPLHALARHAVGALDLSSIAVVDTGDEGDGDVFAAAVREAGGDVVRVDQDRVEQNAAEAQAEDQREDEHQDEDQDEDDAGGSAEENGGDDGADSDAGGESGGADGADEAGEDAASNEGGESGEGGSDDAAGAPPGLETLGADDVGPMLEHAVAEDVDAVFVAGRSGLSAQVVDAAAHLDAELEVFGGEVLRSENFLAEAGSSAEGARTAVSAQLPPTARAEPDAYRDRMAEADAGAGGPFGAAAYDAATAVGRVLNGCLPPASSARDAREGCTGELAQLRFTGVTGEVAFDSFGDREGAWPTVMVLDGGEWRRARVEE